LRAKSRIRRNTSAARNASVEISPTISPIDCTSALPDSMRTRQPVA
jgi:hypothetical protein